MAKRNTYFQDEVVEKKIDAKQFGRILRYVFPYKTVFIFVAVLLLISAAVSMVAPRLIRYIVDYVIKSDDYRQLALVIGGLVFFSGNGDCDYLLSSEIYGYNWSQDHCKSKTGCFL